MKKLLAAMAVITVLGIAPISHAAEGCVATNTNGVVGAVVQCEYTASRPGDVAGVGFWQVEVWWGGICGAGVPDWNRTSFGGSDNNAGGVAGTWEGSIAAGACARATAWTPGSTVVIGDPIPSQGGSNGDQTMDDHACRDSEQGVHVVQGQTAQGGDDYGRGSVCVSDGDASNGADAYAGGEVGTEGSYGPDGALRSCGGIEVAGQQGPGVDPSQERHVFGDDGWGFGNTPEACQ